MIFITLLKYSNKNCRITYRRFFNNHKNDISSKMQDDITLEEKLCFSSNETFIKKMDTESYEDTKKNNIKIILYNNRRKVRMSTPQLDQEEELIV